MGEIVAIAPMRFGRVTFVFCPVSHFQHQLSAKDVDLAAGDDRYRRNRAFCHGIREGL